MLSFDITGANHYDRDSSLPHGILSTFGSLYVLQTYNTSKCTIQSHYLHRLELCWTDSYLLYWSNVSTWVSIAAFYYYFRIRYVKSWLIFSPKMLKGPTFSATGSSFGQRTDETTIEIRGSLIDANKLPGAQFLQRGHELKVYNQSQSSVSSDVKHLMYQWWTYSLSL